MAQGGRARGEMRGSTKSDLAGDEESGGWGEAWEVAQEGRARGEMGGGTKAV